ncbi:DUF6868 family protein [Elusimicrobiota bacterium]
MNIEMLEKFLLWSMILNLGCSLFIFIVVVTCKNTVYRMHSKIFNVSEEKAAETTYKSLTTYKTLFVFFNVIPYIAILIIK